MAKPIQQACGGFIVSEQHKWQIQVSNGKLWENYDTVHTWYNDRRKALKKASDYLAFTRYIKNTGRRWRLVYVSVEHFDARAFYIPKDQMLG